MRLAMPRQDLIARIDNVRALLAEAANDYGPATLASSMSAEDMVLIDLIHRDRLPIDVFTIDTGRLHPETHALVQRARARYRRDIRIIVPDTVAMQEFLVMHGPDGFYTAVDIRKACGHIRKVEPLSHTLAGRNAWITGLRRTQSVTHTDTPEKGWDGENGLYKFNPLATWSSDDVSAYIRDRKVPCNPLHEQTGRQWPENPVGREYGLHVTAQSHHHLTSVCP